MRVASTQPSTNSDVAYTAAAAAAANAAGVSQTIRTC